MPWFIRQTMGIAPWEGHDKAEFTGRFLQPLKRGAALKSLFQRFIARRGYVQGPAGVMFAEPRGSRDFKDIFNAQTGIQFSSDNAGLVVDRAIGRNSLQFNAAGGRSLFHIKPGLRSPWGHLLVAAKYILADRNQLCAVLARPELVPCRIVFRYTQLLLKRCDSFLESRFLNVAAGSHIAILKVLNCRPVVKNSLEQEEKQDGE